MKFFPVQFKLPLLFVVLLLVILTGAGLPAFLATPRPPAVTILPRSTGLPQYRVRWPDRWIPANWGWLWRLKEAVLGKAKTVHLYSTILNFDGSPEFAASNLFLGKPTFSDTNEMLVWFLSTNSMNSLSLLAQKTPGCQVVASPRMTTADEVQARLFSGLTVPTEGGPSQVGISADFYPQLRRDFTELTALMICTEAVANESSTSAGGAAPMSTLSIRTNFATVARLCVPPGNGVFLLDASQQARNGKRTGVLLSIHR